MEPVFGSANIGYESMRSVYDDFKKHNTIIQSHELFRSMCLKRAAEKLRQCQTENSDDLALQIISFLLLLLLI